MDKNEEVRNYIMNDNDLEEDDFPNSKERIKKFRGELKNLEKLLKSEWKKWNQFLMQCVIV